MKIPFRVFDPDPSLIRPRYVWCLRCEDWIPIEFAYGQAHDPHITDHIQVWQALVAVERRDGEMDGHA